MLWTIFLTGMFNILGWIFDALHATSVTALPFVDQYLVTGWGYINFIRVAIPPLGIAIAGFLFIISFKVLLMLIRALPFIGRMFSR